MFGIQLFAQQQSYLERKHFDNVSIPITPSKMQQTARTVRQWYIKLRKRPEQDWQNSPLVFHTIQSSMALPQNTLLLLLSYFESSQFFNFQTSVADTGMRLPVPLQPSPFFLPRISPLLYLQTCPQFNELYLLEPEGHPDPLYIRKLFCSVF